MSATPDLALPLIEAAQASKHVTHNEALLALDALVQAAVLDRDLATPPGSPASGDCYLVPSGGTGAFAGHTGKIAQFRDGAWFFHAPKAGWRVEVIDENRQVVFTGSAWVDAASRIEALQNLALLGLGTTADATNPLAVKANKALLTAKPAAEGGDGDFRFTFNKEAAGDVLSLMLQSGFSARAELGLVGDNDFAVRVSPDGSSFATALKISAATGEITTAAGLARMLKVDRFTASGTWTKPAGAVAICVVLTGGGGGAGGGARTAAGTAAPGGGGGGGAGRCVGWFEAQALTDTVSVTIGAGGAGGAGAATTGPGAVGSAGGTTSFGSFANAYGGGRGSGGEAGIGSAGGGGGSQRGAGGNATGATAGSAGFSLFGGAGGVTSSAAVSGVSGGSGGAGCSTATLAGGNALPAAQGGGGGGGGGGVTAAGAFQPGGYAALGWEATNTAGGATEGAAGADGSVQTQRASSGGSGGAGSATAAGGVGGAGGVPGGGGGGGGGATAGAGGDGGVGGRGEALVLSFF